jgi:hypothetical protein
MAGITGLGTTYGLPNYTGILYALTPADTPFVSAIGGLNGGGQTTSTEFEWGGYDLRAAAQTVRTEGATAPTAEQRVRINVTNVTQVHQEKVSVSYSKLAAAGLKAGTNNDQPSSVLAELDWQVTQMLKQMVRDVEWSFLNGTYVKPANNSTARQTKGLLQAVTTNITNGGTLLGTGLALAATGDTITATAHGLTAGTQVVLRNIATATGVSNDTTYYVNTPTTNTFKVAATSGGSAIDITADGTADVYVCADLSVDSVDTLLQSVYDNGGITESGTAALVLNSIQKRKLSAAYAGAYGKFVESDRTVGGVNMTTITTDFGILNVMLNRHMPQNRILVASLEQCQPVYLEVPEKGHFFAEPLAKTGASDDVQLYGEVGLAYGNEKSHGYAIALKV